MGGGLNGRGLGLQWAGLWRQWARVGAPMGEVMGVGAPMGEVMAPMGEGWGSNG